MRTLVFLLILANLLFLAWTQGYFGAPANPDAQRATQQLLAERVRIVARNDAEAEALKAGKPARIVDRKAADVCLLLAELSIIETERLEARLAEKLPSFRAQRLAVEGRTSFWVFIPPLASRQDAENKAAELKRLGVADFFVIQENGPNNRAISLGLFASHDAAETHLAALRAQGVKSARIVERNSRGASASLELSGPETQVEALRQFVAELLPEGKPVPCRAPSPGT